MRRSGTHCTYAPIPSEMTRTGTKISPRYIIGGTSSGRVSPLIVTSGRPSVTFTSLPGFVTSTVFVAGSYETVAPICSNIERSGTKIVPPRTSAAKTRPCLRTSGFEYTWWSLKRIGISPDGGEPNCIGGTFAAGAVVAGAAGDAIGVADAAADGDAIGVADAAADGDAAGE